MRAPHKLTRLARNYECRPTPAHAVCALPAAYTGRSSRTRTLHSSSVHRTASATSKAEGTIASVFASLSGDAELGFDMPPRFAEMKASFVKDEEHAQALTRAWRSVLLALQTKLAHIAKHKGDTIPYISYPKDPTDAGKSLESWVPADKLSEIRQRGVAVIKGVVPEQQALEWKRRVKDYARFNPTIRGFPEDNKQVFEMYWSHPQIEARSHPSVINTARAFLQLFSAPHQRQNNQNYASDNSRAISLQNLVMYADRLRVRQPGDAKFALGPHIDGGGVERWEDSAFRSFWSEILQGDCDWQRHDPWSLGEHGQRLAANGDLYGGPGQCSVFRPFQGWLSMSHTSTNEGTLRVLPLLKEATAYIILRPFFRAIDKSAAKSSEDPAALEEYLRPDNWKFDATTPDFPGCSLGHNIELNQVTHPHLRLGQTMTSIPKVEPGDMVLWHTDLVHAVEAQHRGKGDSSVMYIPAVPLTQGNLNYLLEQRANFEMGTPPPDFPGGAGEKDARGRAGPEDVKGDAARAAMALQAFDPSTASSELERKLIEESNARMGF